MPDSTSARSPFSIPLFALFEGLILLGYTVRQAWYPPLFFIPIPFIAYYLAFHTTTGTLADVGIGSALIIHVLFALDRLVLTDIQKTLCRVGEKPGQIAYAPFMKRFAWSFHLHCSPRGVRWTHEVQHIPKNSPSIQTRKDFILTRSFSLCVSLGVQGVVMVVNAANPALVPGATPLYNQPLYIRFLSLLGLGIPTLLQMDFQHRVLSILMVCSGISEPEDWPPLFGSVWEMYSVQNLWRNVWHQMLRGILLSTANFIIHTVFHLPRRSPPNSSASLVIGLLKLHTVFLISGLIHFAAEFMPLGYGGRGALYFFMLQAWAITWEIAVRYFLTGSTRGATSDKPPQLIWRVLGYIWVGCWFTAVAPLLQQPMIEAGLFVGPSNSMLVRKVGGVLGLDVI